jgi:UDP-glucose 4-epimerase
VVAKFIRQALNGETCEIYGDGTQTRDFIYIDDLVRAMVLSMEKDVGGETFQIATGLERTVGEVAELIAQALAARGVKMVIEHGQPRLGDVQRNYADTSKAQRILGWRVQTELETGIEKTIEYFIKMQNKKIS